jgi:hypothetical protein
MHDVQNQGNTYEMMLREQTAKAILTNPLLAAR